MLNNLIVKILSFVNSVAERITVVICALVMSQAPQYMNQYLDALKGALFEATKAVKEIESAAEENGMNVKDFISDLMKSNSHGGAASRVAASSGKVHEGQFARYEDYKSGVDALLKSSILTKPYVFLKKVNLALLKTVNFKPAIPLTFEAMVYAIFGIILGMGLYRLLIWVPMRLFRKPQPARGF